MPEQERKKLACAQCKRAIVYGGDLISVEKCVSGPRGIVPLGDALTFCSEECIAFFFDGTCSDDRPKVKDRIPRFF